jgi:hypothetical protein
LHRAGASSNRLIDLLVIFLLSALTVVAFTPLQAAPVLTSASNVTVASVDQNGNVIPHDYYDVFQAANSYGPDNLVANGVTTSTFATIAGSSYTLQVYGYGSCTFSNWSNGGTSDPMSFTATTGALSFIAVYDCGSTNGGISTGSSILVNSAYTGGAVLTGVYAVLEKGGATVATGFTPVTFTTTIGLNYSVIISNSTNAYFSQWSNGPAINTMVVAAKVAQTSLTAIFCPTSCPSSTGVVSGGKGPTGSITVTSRNLVTGGALSGMFIDLRLNNNHIESGYTPVTFSGLQQGAKYLVVVYGYGDTYFRHFSNGNLQRYSYVTLNATAGQTSYSLNALFENVPNAQAASLNIIAQFPNGTQIGTASEIGGYPQHTPGMYLSVTPPGATSAYTATFTGGSILPFIFFYGQTYTVSMSTGYSNITFSYWKDNGSTDPTRAFTLNGNSVYTAVYTQK